MEITVKSSKSRCEVGMARFPPSNLTKHKERDFLCELFSPVALCLLLRGGEI